MARVPLVSPDDLDPQDQDLLKRPIHLYRALANSPGALRANQGLGQWIRWKCELDPRLRELIILTVGYLTASPYEFSHHIGLSRSFGVTDDDIAQLISYCDGGPSSLGELERAAADAARQLTEQRELGDETWDVLAAHLSPPRLVEVVLIIGFYNSVVRVLAGLKIEVEPDYLVYLDEFPLPGGGA